MRKLLVATMLLALAAEPLAIAQDGSSVPSLLAAQPHKKKRRGKKKRSKAEAEAQKQEEAKKREEEAKAAEDAKNAQKAEEERVEAAKKKLELERRQSSKLTPGAASRWSNRGAMVPIASPVPVTAKLPARAVPITTTVETPGQSLLGGGSEEILSARLSFSGYHLQTSGLDRVLGPTAALPNPNAASQYDQGDWSIPTVQADAGSRDIDFLRARATLGYDHIAGSDFALHLDVEYRPQINGSRFTDYRLNEAYASYGLNEFRSTGGPWWGVALGRLAIREAGYAQADGIAARFRIVDWLRAGLFGGVTGNPYGYNWNLRSTEVFSADWYTGGAFVSLQLPELVVNVAGVVTYANIAANLADIDRAYLYLDGSWLILPELNMVVNGWFDVLPGGQAVQNVTGSFSWTPFDDLSLALGGGRFSTVLYAVSGGYTFSAAGTNAVLANNGDRTVLGQDNQPIVPFDAVLMTSVYNSAWVRGAYRVLRDLEISARFNALIRDSNVNRDALVQASGNTIAPSAVRLVPGLGARYRNPDIIDANFEVSYIVDDESQAKAVVSGGIGRGLFGLYLGADARYYAGEIPAFDTGGTLTYTLPRDWFPGALSLRGTFRYFRESVALYLQQPDLGAADYYRQDGGGVAGWDKLSQQETILAFGGIEWRL